MRLPRLGRVLVAALLLSSALLVSMLFRNDVIEVNVKAKDNDVQRRVHQGQTTEATVSVTHGVTSSPSPCSQPEGECDSECLRFHQLMVDWPANKPRAFIYYLVQNKTLQKLNTSIRFLDTNFNDRGNYPVIVFVEPELDNDVGRRAITSFTTNRSRLFIQVVRFSVPEFLKAKVPRLAGNAKSVGYRHMCRFHAVTVYRHPIVRTRPSVEYAWRLDDDSFIVRPINYDVFAFMRDRRLQYGYVQIRDESPYLIRGLWDAAGEYVRRHGGFGADDSALPEFYRTWKMNKIFYNNFELSDMSVWMSDEYCRLTDHVDRRGGIYYRRWGDAPIKTIAVTLLIPRNRTYRFVDIAYKHSSYFNRGRRPQLLRT